MGEELCPPVDPGLPLTCLPRLRTAAHWAVQIPSSRARPRWDLRAGRQAGILGCSVWPSESVTTLELWTRSQ